MAQTDTREKKETGKVTTFQATRVNSYETTDEEIAECFLLLTCWEAVELERLASSLDLTVGQLIRRLIREYLVRHG